MFFNINVHITIINCAQVAIVKSMVNLCPISKFPAKRCHFLLYIYIDVASHDHISSFC